ncbi:MAG: NYN domain-containing protein [Methanoregula sp.]
MIFDKDPFLQNIPQKKLAVLIDADNAQPEIIEGLLAEISLYGIASVKRIYGNWTSPNLKPWKEVLLNYSIQPIQQFEYTKGKNATDSALIIDAMDLLYTNKFDGFCIVSSDSDFTRLAQRVRESGLLVYGFGERKTPKPFVQACDKFVYTEILRKSGLTDEEPPETQKGAKSAKSLTQLKDDVGLLNLLRSVVDGCSNDDGWANLADVGGNIVNQYPDFDPRNYGFKKLKELVEATDLFEIDVKQVGNSPAKVIYVKDKKFKTIQFSPTYIRKTSR